jgi:hypothetical protein
MSRKAGTGFPSRQTQSLCAEIMLNQKPDLKRNFAIQPK